jgi:hypothetical protein
MTTAELVAAARDIVPPVGAGALCLLVDDDQRYRAAFVVNGRQKVAAGPAFTRPRDAARFMDLLAGDAPTSRSALTDIPADTSASAASRAISSSGNQPAQTGAPEQSLTPAGANGVGSTPRAGASGERIPESGALIPTAIDRYPLPR